jgi:hypothetical protein
MNMNNQDIMMQMTFCNRTLGCVGKTYEFTWNNPDRNGRLQMFGTSKSNKTHNGVESVTSNTYQPLRESCANDHL